MNVTSRMTRREPRIAKKLVVIAASAGGLAPLREVLAALPRDLPAAIAVVLHHAPSTGGREDPLAELLRHWVALRVEEAAPLVRPREGTIYVAPPRHHLVVAPGKYFRLIDGRRIRGVLSSANPLFQSAADAFAGRVVGVVLSGRDRDATNGVQSVAASGGVVIAQDPATARAPGMPESAIETGAVKSVMAVEEIAPEIVRLVQDAGKR